MKYVVTYPRLVGVPEVKFHSRWLIVAAMAAVAIEMVRDRVTKIITIDDSPQGVLQLEDQRVEAIERGNCAVEILANLVSRDDEGRWTTVHDADAVVDRQAELSALLA